MTVPKPDSEVNGGKIQSLETTSQILEYIASASGRPRTAAEIARGVGLTPPRTWRYLNSLEALGYVTDAGPRQGFVLGARLARLGQTAIERLNIDDVSRKHLVNLRDELREAAYLAVPQGNDAVVVISLESDGPLVIRASLGMTFIGHASASGRTLMAFASEAKRARYLEGPLAVEGNDPLVDPGELFDRYATIRDRFFETSRTGEARRSTGTLFINAISAPVFDHQNEVVGAVGVLTGLPDEKTITGPRIRGALFDCAARISEDLGATRWVDSGHLPLSEPQPE